MSPAPSRSAPQSGSLRAWLAAQERKSLLRFLTCGSVDDGKSTLIGRLLYESQLLFDDQLAALERDAKRAGGDGALDFASLVDGLAAERAQGITIDVAYRFFATQKRKFIVADAPGHEQYTRNMATGASGAELAVVLLDARKGVLTQTRRHAFIVSLLGIRHMVLACNKMDLVDYKQERFQEVVAEFKSFAKDLKFANCTAIPLCARDGDNVVTRARKTMGWYRGPSLLAFLERVEVARPLARETFAMPVQRVVRTGGDFRGLAGQIAQGRVKPKDELIALPSQKRARVAKIVTMDGDLKSAQRGQSITLTLDKELDVSRGDVLCTNAAPLETSDQFEATILWMADAPMLPGRPLRVQCGTALVGGSVMGLKHRINVNTMARSAARSLGLNEIGVCTLALDRPLAFAPYAQSATLGGFILIDRTTNATVGAGMLHFGLQRAQNIARQKLSLTKADHAAQKNQRPAVLWLTGLSGAGKSTIANELQKLIYAAGGHSALLDGDNVRHGLCRDLGFAEADRVENIRRVGEAAKLMAEAGLIVLVSFIAPFQAERAAARALVDEDEFLEIFVDTTLQEAERRDPKGLYKKARAGVIPNFTGLTSPYEPPPAPEIHIDTQKQSAKMAAKTIFEELRRRGILGA